MRRLASFPVFADTGKQHPTLPVTSDGLVSIDGLSGTEHFHRTMDSLCKQEWAYEYSPREAARLRRVGYFPEGIQLHIWAGEWSEATVHQPVDGSSNPLWRVKTWVPGLVEAASLVGKTGTVITMDAMPSWPIFEVNGTESGTDWGPIVQCMEPAHARGQWTVEAVEYIITPSHQVEWKLAPFALLLKAVEVAEVK